jgi:type I restriction enzyme S subunit
MKTTTKTGFKRTEVGVIPEDWEVIKLEDVSSEITDGSHFSPKESPQGAKIIATVRDMRYNRFAFEDCKTISERDFDRLVRDGCSPTKGDILISKDGANCLDLIFVYNQEERIVVLSSIAIVRLKPGFDPYFYRYYLLSPTAQQIMRSGYVTGSAIPRIVLKDLKGVPVPKPKLETQKRISGILSSFDSKIELNQQMNKTLEAIGKAIFKHWFIDFEFPNEEGKPYKSSGGEMVYNQELGKEIPKGWRPGHLGDVAGNPRRGIQPEIVDRGTPYIGLEHMPRRSIALSDWGVVEEAVSNKFQFYSGDILFGKLRPYFHKVGVAPVDGVCSTDILVIVPKSRELFGLVLGHVSSTEFVNYVDAASTGTRMPRTNWGDMALYEILIPTDSLARAFNDTILPLLNRIKANILQSRTLTTIRDSLLPKLMSGKIRVPVEAR